MRKDECDLLDAVVDEVVEGADNTVKLEIHILLYVFFWHIGL